MKMGCLGWGSLVWDPRDLPLKSEWREDGPELSLEFCRQSKNGRITLVVTPDAQRVCTLWCELEVGTLDDAVEALRRGEGTASRFVGRSPDVGNAGSNVEKTIRGWAAPRGIDGVVWAALPPKFNGQDITPSCEQVIAHLNTTSGAVRADSETYVRRAPPQISTAYRAEIERQLGWTPL